MPLRSSLTKLHPQVAFVMFQKLLSIPPRFSLGGRAQYPRVNGLLRVAADVIVLTRLTLGTMPYTPSTISLGLLLEVWVQSPRSLFPSYHHDKVLGRATPQRKSQRSLLLVLLSETLLLVLLRECCFDSVGVLYTLRYRRSREV